jgi:hypothetical protein
MADSMNETLQSAFDSTDITVSIYCGFGEIPEGMDYEYRRETSTYYVDGEPWCTEVGDAHMGDADTFCTVDAAKALKGKGWSFNKKTSSWRCPHCTKRGDKFFLQKGDRVRLRSDDSFNLAGTIMSLDGGRHGNAAVRWDDGKIITHTQDDLGGAFNIELRINNQKETT